MPSVASKLRHATCYITIARVDAGADFQTDGFLAVAPTAGTANLVRLEEGGVETRYAMWGRLGSLAASLG